MSATSTMLEDFRMDNALPPSVPAAWQFAFSPKKIYIEYMFTRRGRQPSELPPHSANATWNAP